MDYGAIKKVHVVYKTHLDVGFTDMAQNVLDRYLNEHIPHSINLAFELNTRENKKFIWTLGSYLIDYYLKNADPKACEKLIEAIRLGYICWHGLPFTTHTELLDRGLLEYGIQIGQRLDKTFGKKTISAKMTDVPGHTIALVDSLADAGIRFLHIGVNASSMVPGIPGTFVWKHGDKKVIVQYSATYGAPGYVEGMDEVLEFAHTGDNLGPQDAAAVEKEFARIKALYPNARVEASTMDDYAQSLLAFEDSLPVVEEEIGDTWIHGVGSDPYKISRYKALLALREKWAAQGRFDEETPGYDDFMLNLLLIPEHTWGLDYKKYLADFKHWKKEDFQKARAADITTLDDLTNRNASMRDILAVDIDHYRGGVFTGSYKAYEASHAEQRAYLDKAVKALPQPLKEEAAAVLASLDPVFDSPAGVPARIGETLAFGGTKVRFTGDGRLSLLEKDGKNWAGKDGVGFFSYETYNVLNTSAAYYRYNRSFYDCGCWSEGDFAKPGLEFCEDLENKRYPFSLVSAFRDENTLTLSLAGDEDASARYGCPREARIVYTFGEEGIHCSLSWRGKDANRMPEALWFAFDFGVENPARWRMVKLGCPISPLDVLKGGNRLQHCVDGLSYRGTDGKIDVKTLHAPLVSPGGPNLYDDVLRLPDLEKGFAFCLFNNRWGTNFKMWCEDDCRFDFDLSF